MTLPDRRNYCRECYWSASTAEYGMQELGRRAIEHALETGHDIDCEFIEEDPREQGSGSPTGRS